jgi:hypothetical protein
VRSVLPVVFLASIAYEWLIAALRADTARTAAR